MHRRPRVAGLLAVVAVVLLPACGGSDDPTVDAVEQAIETQLGGDASVQVEDDSITVDTETGSISAGTGDVPEDFPAEVPLIDGDVVFAQRSQSPEGTGWTVQVLTTTSPDDATAELTQALQGAGFAVQSEPSQAGTTLLADQEDLSVLVLVATSDDGTSVLYTVDTSATP